MKEFLCIFTTHLNTQMLRCVADRIFVKLITLWPVHVDNNESLIKALNEMKFVWKKRTLPLKVFLPSLDDI